jgi:hypothetical protein
LPGIRCVVDDLFEILIVRFPALAMTVDRQIARDSKQPRREPDLIRLPPVRVGPDAQKRFLRDFVCVGRIAGHADEELLQPREVSIEEA